VIANVGCNVGKSPANPTRVAHWNQRPGPKMSEMSGSTRERRSQGRRLMYFSSLSSGRPRAGRSAGRTAVPGERQSGRRSARMVRCPFSQMHGQCGRVRFDGSDALGTKLVLRPDSFCNLSSKSGMIHSRSSAPCGQLPSLVVAGPPCRVRTVDCRDRTSSRRRWRRRRWISHNRDGGIILLLFWLESPRSQ